MTGRHSQGLPPVLYLLHGLSDDRRGIPMTASFVPGEHDWGLWDQQNQQVVAWLPLEGAGPQRPSRPASGPTLAP